MVFKNLTCRKGRTIVTLVGVTIGVTAIIAPGRWRLPAWPSSSAGSR